MKKRPVFVLGVVSVIAGSASLGVRAQDTRPPRVRVAGIFDGQLVTKGEKIYARAPADSTGVQFIFQPETGGDVRIPPVVLGTDTGHMEPTFGPDCGSSPCQKRVFSVALEKQLSDIDEGWGQLTVRDIGTGEGSSVRIYWDDSPPVATILSPRFDASLAAGDKIEVVAHTFDDDIIAIKVKWILAPLFGRDIPTFEQHNLGFDFAGHAACVPTSVGASLQWLQDAGLANVINPIYQGDNKKLVEALGMAMQTTTSGTGGGDARDGLAVFLFFTTGLLAGRDYTLDHLGPGSGTYGFTPEEMLEQFQAGGAITVGFHNLSSDDSFGHMLALSSVSVNDDGTAWVRVMDPNVEPNPGGQMTGEFRTFKLHKNGKIDWTDANPGYYSPASGQVKLDELLIARDFGAVASSASVATSGPGETGGEVSGKVTDGGRTFVGTFTPPAGSPGPWLLVSESTQRAGHTQRAYRFIGGVARPR